MIKFYCILFLIRPVHFLPFISVFVLFFIIVSSFSSGIHASILPGSRKKRKGIHTNTVAAFFLLLLAFVYYIFLFLFPFSSASSHYHHNAIVNTILYYYVFIFVSLFNFITTAWLFHSLSFYLLCTQASMQQILFCA